MKTKYYKLRKETIIPNWCTNYVKISSHDPIGDNDKKAIKKLLDKLTSNRKKMDEFDFNAIVPMPKELELESGSRTDTGLGCFVEEKFQYWKNMPWFEDTYPGIVTMQQFHDHIKKTAPEIYKMGKQAFNNLNKYGYADWYDWAVDNWGTKWNASDAIYDYISDSSFEVRFDTAWSPPEPIFNKLEDDGFEVVGYWHEEGGEEGYIGGSDIGVNVYKSVEVEFED